MAHTNNIINKTCDFDKVVFPLVIVRKIVTIYESECCNIGNQNAFSRMKSN